MYHVRRLSIFVACFLYRQEKAAEDKLCDQHSRYWLDRQACRWLSLCGIHHLTWDPAALLPWNNNSTDDGELFAERLELRSLGDNNERHAGWEVAGRTARGQLADRGNVLQQTPDYVLKYAPLVHLYSKENFWPSDIAEHVQHMIPYLETEALNRTALLDDLHELNGMDGQVFLTADVDVESRPEWLHSHSSIPHTWRNDNEEPHHDYVDDGAPSNQPGGQHHPSQDTTWYDVSRGHPVNRISDPRRLGQQFSPKGRKPVLDRKTGFVRRDQQPMPADPTPINKPHADGYSKAPAVLILVDKGDGIVDAFWFFFYSYNLGQTVANIRFGNHVGDWEHCMMRFEHGIPRGIFFSEHEGGQAYTYNAVEKRGDRPVLYSAVGSHAMYAQPGFHPYILPFKLLKDVTDRGPLWDPAKNTYSYWYDYERDVDDGLDVDADVDGEVEYLLSRKRCQRFFVDAHRRESRRPRPVRLGREKLCITNRCRILDRLKPGQTWY
ncbi:vacuolar protein sorting-associated protein [Verticillium dahliae]|nr:vacuolar protein sorting-associated protein [Verticillium dahliae]